MLIAAASCLLMISTTEKCFDAADKRSAITMVKVLRANRDAPTLPEAMIEQHAGATSAAIGWSATITDSHYGFVRVRAAVPGAGEVTEYLFDVNLAGNRLHPANDLARELMTRLRYAL